MPILNFCGLAAAKAIEDGTPRASAPSALTLRNSRLSKTRPMRLEVKLQSELDLPRWAGEAGNLTEIWIGYGRSRWSKLRLIPEVESLNPELERFAFRNGELPEERHIPQRDSRRTRARRGAAISEEELPRHGVSVGIEPRIDRLMDVRAGNAIGTVP